MQGSKSQILSWVKFLIGWPLSAVSILFIVKLVIDKSSQLSLNFNKINFSYLLLSIILFFVYYLLRSYLWRMQLQEKGYKINFRENTYRFAFSELKRYTPGNIWSMLSRAAQFKQVGVDNKTIGVSLIADSQLVIIGCGIVSLVSLPWLLDSPNELKLKLVTLFPIIIAVLLIWFVATALIYKRKYAKNESLPSSLILPAFELNSKIKLTMFAVVTYAAFGIGNYFAFISIFQTAGNPLIISSFFVFSLLIGFLSFITPMGLGVREAVVTLGLTKIMSITNAGAVSIFTRIVLVISELSFLILVFLWQKAFSKK